MDWFIEHIIEILFYGIGLPILLLFAWVIGSIIWDSVYKHFFPEEYAAKLKAEIKRLEKNINVSDSVDDTPSRKTSSRRSRSSKKNNKEDVEKAYRDGMNDGLWGDSFRYDSNNKGRTERERRAYEQGCLDHADEEDF